MKELVDAARANDVTDIIIAHEHRGQPGILKVFSYILFLFCRWSYCITSSLWTNSIFWPFKCCIKT